MALPAVVETVGQREVKVGVAALGTVDRGVFDFVALRHHESATHHQGNIRF